MNKKRVFVLLLLLLMLLPSSVYAVNTGEVCVDITQCTYSMVKPTLADALKRKFGDKCENIDEAFQM